MATEWIDIVDTAVKIGLGGLISGVATYYVTQLKHIKEDESSKKEVVRTLLLEAVKNADEYFDFIYDYFSIIAGFAHNSKDMELSDDDWKVIYTSLKEKEEHLQKFRRAVYTAESRLQLLGFEEPVKILSDFQIGESELRQLYRKKDKTMLQEQFFVDWAKKYLPLKNAFQKAVSDLFLSYC